MKLLRPPPSLSLLLLLLLLLCLTSESKDLYQVLGVEKNASQRDIQKAFHKMSLKYHPDKNPSKNAQEKFSEINNAYEVLSDEEKRKNYDLFGDEQGRSRGPDANAYNDGYNNYEQRGGYSGSSGWSQSGSKGWSFSYSSNDHSGYRTGRGFAGSDDSYDYGNYFSFPFESQFEGQGRSSFGFGGDQSSFGNIFDSFFGTAQGRQSEEQHYTSYTTSKTKKTQKDSSQHGDRVDSLAEQLTPKTFVKRVLDQSYTWAIIFTPHVSKEFLTKLELMEKITGSLRDSLKVGYVNCERFSDFCKEYKMLPIKAPKLRFYSLRSNGNLSALDYTGEWSEKDIKGFCLEALPKFSKHVKDIRELNAKIEDTKTILWAVLLTRKKATPAMWRVLSGIFYERIHFLDLQVNDNEIHIISEKFKVDRFPAIIGIYPDGASEVLADGNSLDQSRVSVDDLKSLLEGLEKSSKSRGSGNSRSNELDGVVSLSRKNIRAVCGPETPLCIIGAYKSPKAMEEVKQILKEISQKTLTRRQRPDALTKPVSFCVLDGARHTTFLSSFNDKLSKRNSIVLIAYKPKKGTFAMFDGALSIENVENFVVQILSGDFQFNKVAHDPVLD